MKIGNLDIVNDEFSTDEEIDLLVPFVENEDKYFGEVVLSASPKDDLHFHVEIPKSYPLSDSDISVKFFIKGEVEAAHINLDNSVCIHTPLHQDFKVRLKSEIRLLKDWRDHYYINQEKDDRYEYLITSFTGISCFLFTNTNHRFTKDDFGEFRYTIFSDHSIPSKGIDAHQAFVLDIGGYKCEWSDKIHNQTASTGFYVFIEDEPIKRPYRIATDWIELEPYLSDEFLRMLYGYKSQGHKPHKILILVGYNISDSSGKEAHWQMISLMSNEIPVYGQKIGPKQYTSACVKKNIDWIKCVNSGYSRYFGRGGISSKLADKKILIIGAGAVGSRLASILVRAGIRHLDICDGDHVEPGNICRSDYYIVENQLPKTVALSQHLEAISPFVNVNIHEKISKRAEGGRGERTRTMLESYDLVVDCTSDNELSYFLDQLSPSTRICNISISNEAKEMVLVTGAKLTSQKRSIFERLETSDPELIYEGTGCWSPTFKAANFDIDSMLNLLVQNLNYQIEMSGAVRTMVIKREIFENKVTLKTIDY